MLRQSEPLEPVISKARYIFRPEAIQLASRVPTAPPAKRTSARASSSTSTGLMLPSAAVRFLTLVERSAETVSTSPMR